MPKDIKKRGISQAVFDAFKLQYYDEKLEIPIFDITGKKIFSKYRHYSGPNKYTYDKGGTAQLYGAHLIKNKTTVVLTEGELDTLVLWSNGIPAVSTTSGAASNYKEEWIELLKDKTLYICYDNDEAGKKGAAKLKKIFPNAIVLFLKDVKDISEYYEKHGEVQSIFNLTEGKLPVLSETTSQTHLHQSKQSIITLTKDERIEKAKQYPITNLLKFNKNKKCNCIWHNEKTASLHYNEKENTVKCFGCGEFGDAIAVYQQINNVDFTTALNEMVGPARQTTLRKEIQKKGEKNKSIQFLMTSGKNPQVRKIGPNIKLIFDNDPDFKGKFRYDSFNGVFETSFLNDKWEAMEDHILRVVISTIQEKYPYFDTGVEKIIKDYAILSAMENSVSPPLQYIESIKWDGIPRLAIWLHKTYYVPNNQYYAEIGTKWLKYLVKRLKYPGCKFDHVLVMRGVQGFGKSMILKKLCELNGHDYFIETTNTPDQGKDFMIELMGNIVVEFAEGAITGYKDQKKVKSFITKQVDNYRPPYMKSAARFPRQCVFAMTTNETEFLKDKTGERRYWLMEIPEKKGLYGNYKWIEENRDQLFAEALTLVDEPYKFLSDEAQKYLDDLIDGHKEIDPVEDAIVDWFNNLTIKRKNEGISVGEGKEQITDDLKEYRTKYLDKEIAYIYVNVLKLKQMRKMIGNTYKRLYFPTELTPMINGDIDITTSQMADYIDDF